MSSGRGRNAVYGLRLVVLMWLVCVALPAPGEEKQPDSLLPSLRVCAALSKNAERLACYDRTVADAVAGVAPAGQERSPEEMFGITQNSARDEKAQPVKREVLNEITARVQELRERPDGALFILLDNGQTWQRTDNRETLILRVGDPVRIMRAALGSFRLITEGQRFAKVVRVK